MSNRVLSGTFIPTVILQEMGLNQVVLKRAIKQTYSLLDKIDNTLVNSGVDRISQTVELANLSSMIGNILGTAIAQHSQGVFERNGPHKFPDLLCRSGEYPDLEIKIALENNKPKGHLAKSGNYIICRYVLCDVDGSFKRGKQNRGVVPYIWELRCGHLIQEHFNLSNTEGDSGKTAVINAEGMKALNVVYCDLDRTPVSKKGRIYSEYSRLVQGIN